ncbi:sensor histidine kinase [Hydrogenimonas sp.]
MKWYKSLKVRSALFFALISLLFLGAVVVNFALIKQHRLTLNAERAIDLATKDVIARLLIDRFRNEQAVTDMARAASVGWEAPAAAILGPHLPADIVGGGLWPPPEERSKKAVLFQRGPEGAFVAIHDFDAAREAFYGTLSFDTLAKGLTPGKTRWSDVYRDPDTLERMVTVLAPVFEKGRLAGLASLDIRLALQKKEIFSKLLHSENYFALFDRAGTPILLSANIPADMVPRLLDKVPAANTPVDVDDTLGVRRHIHILDHDRILHEKAVVAHFRFPGTGWRMVVGIPEHLLLADFNKIYKEITVTTILFILLFLLAGYLFIHRTFLTPLSSVTEQIEQSGSQELSRIETRDEGEIGLLVRRYNERNETLAKTLEHDALSQKLLMQQSKMAAMGEMLDAVAHQWKQPLNALSLYNDLLVGDFREGKVDEAYMERFRRDIQAQIDHMADTLATFRSFFRPDTDPGPFSLKKVIDDVLFLAKDDLMKHGIQVRVEGDDMTLYGYANEFKHLLLNFLTNARDAFVENGAKERVVTIRLVDDPDDPRLEFEDTAGGIPPEHLESVFKPHFTTKSDGKGTGIGLYMSTQIAEKHHARLSVENREKGACFVVHFSAGSFPRKG